MTEEFKHYSDQQLAAMRAEDRIVWLDFPSSFRFLIEHWVKQTSPRARPDLEHLVAYSVMKSDAPNVAVSSQARRRAWTFPPLGRVHSMGSLATDAVDPASIIAGQPSRLAEGAVSGLPRRVSAAPPPT